MPAINLRGGKAFKKGKKAPADKKIKFIPRANGQDYARVVKLLGNRRATCFCNDGNERIGKFRGSICKGPKKQIIAAGDIVLVSFRDFGEISSESDSDLEDLKDTTKEVCDILFKYDRSDWRAIGKEAGIHADLLGTEKVMDDIFDFDQEENMNIEDI